MKLFAAILSTLLLLNTATVSADSNITGSVKSWARMQKAGWASADNIDYGTMEGYLYKSTVIGNYPWTRQFLIHGRQGGYFLADKKNKVVRKLNLHQAGEYSSDLEALYHGEDNGKGCYFVIIDTHRSIIDKAVDDVIHPVWSERAEDDATFLRTKIENIKKQLAPKVISTFPEQCTNKKQQAALVAKQSAEEQKLQQWVAQQTLAELCRRTGNC
ncbi:hypothetical protein ACRRG6_004006 [Escherichia coli]|uniref:hypothetical protein n=1 Tax=Escherichia TaxID=561 RepID=UPI000BB7884A|nr:MULTISPECIES: hypothetical protein [Escherichia]EEZ5617244.1 hypothetical protein [Escherichia coli]EHI1087623.1 hypothetical protein [Escherichia coli]EIM2789567.1 hypothetical protein [Escherichia coli]EKG7204354.1 hypothetical protein [Escherichia coli]EKR0420509.1 hypothetical protein [Escherichia coli]